MTDQGNLNVVTKSVQNDYDGCYDVVGEQMKEYAAQDKRVR